jgi:hypothetical protein
MRKEKFSMPHKVGMINLWRKRCTAYRETKPVNPADCAICDELAREICLDIQECTERRAFGNVHKEAAAIASKN